MAALYDVAAIGNAIVDVIASADDAFLAEENLTKGSMMLIDEPRADALYGRMAEAVETSGGSAANTIAGVASLGGRAHYVGKVAADDLGEIFAHDIRAIGADYETSPLTGGPATARCLINVTPDGERTMCTYLGASVRLTPADVTPEAVIDAHTLYLEGYLFDPDEARRAFAKAAAIARGAGRSIALSLSDPFVVERHRAGLLAFIDAEVDVLLANEAEAGALFHTTDLDAALEALRGRVRIAAVTRGAAGSVILANGSTVSVAAEPVEKVIDTTGAGDQYAAGFLVGLARDRPLAECGRLGSLAAAEVIAHVGPRPQTSLEALAASRGL
jgi:sugar/nucleoside kinase (ribokinase family)